MYCPNCAKENSVQQKFCRACGLNLETITVSLNEQLPDFAGGQISHTSRTFELLGKLGFGGLISAGVMGIVILLAVIVSKFVLAGELDKVILGVFLILLVMSAALGLAFVILQEVKKDANKSRAIVRQEDSEVRNTSKLLEEKAFEPVPSVIEETTDLLLTRIKPQTSGDLK